MRSIKMPSESRAHSVGVGKIHLIDLKLWHYQEESAAMQFNYLYLVFVQ